MSGVDNLARNSPYQDKKKGKIPFHNFSLDSFKIRILYQKCEIINPEIEAHWIKWNADQDEAMDGEIFKNNSLTIKGYHGSLGLENGITYRYIIEHQARGVEIEDTGKKIPLIHKYVCILINSKWLQEQYFEGIVSRTVRSIYDTIIDQQVISCTYQDFLMGELTDIDVKVDSRLKPKAFKNLIEFSRQVTKPTREMLGGYKSFGGKGKKMWGIQWSERRAGVQKSPFMKYYHKEKELHTKSQRFLETYLGQYDINNVVRYEMTIKNKKHFKALFGNDDTRLGTVLGISQKDWNRCAVEFHEAHFKSLFNQIKKEKGDLEGKDKAFASLIRLAVLNSGLTEEIILNEILKQYDSKQVRYRMKGWIKDMLEYVKFTDEQVRDNMVQNRWGQNFIMQYYLKAGFTKKQLIDKGIISNK